MPRFFYAAKNLNGDVEEASLEAEDERHLSSLLKKKGYFLISVEKSNGNGKMKKRFQKATDVFSFFGVPLSEKLFFTRNLEVMIRTGVPLPKGFRILSSQAKSTKLKRALNSISESIIKGSSLSAALGRFPDIFSTLYQETLKVGEETGKIEDALKILASQMEKEHNLKSGIQTAMVYPCIVLGMAFMIGIFMMVFAVPKLTEAFAELNVDLPITTKIILGLADFLTKRWPFALLIIFGLVVGLVALLKSKIGKKTLSYFSIRVPVISKITKKTNAALALRIISSLLKAGVPIVKSLEITSGALSNLYFTQSLKEAARIVEKGKKISQALSPYSHLYSEMVLQMMEVGEETGETSEILSKLADFYEEEVLSATQRLSTIIEPVLILFVGAVVGFFAVSMMQPMFSIMGGM